MGTKRASAVQADALFAETEGFGPSKAKKALTP